MSEDTSSSIETKQKRTVARKKIEIKKIKNKNSLYVTFSKRRGGLFRKAGTLSALCGVELAVLVFSPTGNPFVYGYPSVDSVISRLASMDTVAPGQRVPMHASDDHDVATQGSIVQSSSAQWAYQTSPGTKSRFLGLGHHSGLESMAEETEEEDEDAARRRGGGFWWDQPIEKMTLHEVKQFRSSLEKLRANVTMRMDEMEMRKLAERDFLGVNPNGSCG